MKCDAERDCENGLFFAVLCGERRNLTKGDMMEVLSCFQNRNGGEWVRRLTGMAECRGRKIRYYILSERLGPKKVCFGISVVYRGEEVRIRAVSEEYGAIRALLKQLKRGRVTPVAVRDVVDDWALDSACNFAWDFV